jgi:hypothetical protein
VLPTIVCDHTTPLICTVGRPSALTVVGVVGSAGFVGLVSAWAGTARAKLLRTMTAAATMLGRRRRGDTDFSMECLLQFG